VLALVVASAYCLLSSRIGNPQLRWPATTDYGGVDEASVEPAFHANPEKQGSSSRTPKSVLVQSPFLHTEAANPIAATNQQLDSYHPWSIVVKSGKGVISSSRY
jgi:hypothetical protein